MSFKDCLTRVLFFIGLSSLGFLVGCSSGIDGSEAAMNTITAESLSKNTEMLASDRFEGRSPASRGEELTVNFLKDEFSKLGLQPGNKGSFFQEVPLVEITSVPDEDLSIKGNGKAESFTFGKDYAAVTSRMVDEVGLDNSPIVFVGYGIVAPEYQWNDYHDVDVKGKTVLILVNDPGFATEDPTLFDGRAMTYYGRWTYKFEEAARQGAAGAFIVHETEPAAYGWGVVENGWTGSQFLLPNDDKNLSNCAVEGWFTREVSQKILERAGLKLDDLKESALTNKFKAVPLNLTASLKMKSRIKQSVSRNVIAVVPGQDAPDEYVFYLAHWDHFGLDPNLEGDQIFNGALDNATGTAGLIELARAFQSLPSPPRRSIVFLAVTGEEQGLLGSLYYAENPVFPTSRTVAAINLDALNIYGRMKDISIVGYGKSELDNYLAEAAAEQGRTIRPDATPEKGSYYRSDHFNFARKGVPALFPNPGRDHIEFGEEWTKAQNEKYIAEKYHQTSDGFDPNWDLSGAIDDLRLVYKIGYRLSMELTYPEWNEGTEFKAVREKDLKDSAF